VDLLLKLLEVECAFTFCSLSSRELPTILFRYYALQRSPNIEQTGSVVTPLVLSLLLAWIVVYFSMIRGVKSSGKVSDFLQKGLS